MLINKERMIQCVKDNSHANNYFEQIKKELKAYDLSEILQNVKEKNDLYAPGFIHLKMCFYSVISNDKSYDYYIKEFALAFCNAPKWENQGARNGWISDLLTADLSFNLGLAFYLTKELFTESEQALIKKSLMEKGFAPLYTEWVNPDTRKHCLDTMGHNWWSVCVCGLGGLVLTMDDDTPNKQKYLLEIVDSIKQWLTYSGDRHVNKHANFGPEGDYIEYVGYMMYGLSNFTSFEELYRRSTGDTSLFDISPLEKTVDYIISCLHKVDGKWKFPKFSDTKDENGTRHSLLYLANHYNRGDMLDVYEGLVHKSCSAYDLIFFENLTVEQKPVAFKPLTVYPHTGFAFVHGENDFLFAIKTGETGCHNHRDNGTFTISHKNKELIIDSGTCKYSLKEYLPYFCAPVAHNVITFNGEGIREDGMYGGGVAAMGEIASHIDEPDYKYILADCTQPYLNVLQKNMRHVIFLKDVIFMIDDIYAEVDGEAEFLLHYAGNAEVNGNDITIQNGDAFMRVSTILPGKPEITTKEGLLECLNGEFEKTSYFSIKGNTKNKRIKFITAFIFDEAIRIEQKQAEDILELSIKRNGIKERLIVNFLTEKKDVFNNAHIVYDNIKTNAFITYLKEKGNDLLGAALTNGFYLYHNDKKVFMSLKNSDVYLK